MHQRRRKRKKLTNVPPLPKKPHPQVPYGRQHRLAPRLILALQPGDAGRPLEAVARLPKDVPAGQADDAARVRVDALEVVARPVVVPPRRRALAVRLAVHAARVEEPHDGLVPERVKVHVEGFFYVAHQGRQHGQRHF